MTLRPGAHAYLSDEGDHPGTRTVCDSAAAFVAAHHTTTRVGCTHRRAFGLVRIERLAGYERDAFSPWRVPLVLISSADRKWHGVVLGLALTPIVPSGTMLAFASSTSTVQSLPVFFSRSRTIAARARFDITVDRRTLVRVIRQYPPDEAHYPLYVRIENGKYRNRYGWTIALFTTGGVPAQYMQDPRNSAGF